MTDAGRRRILTLLTAAAILGYYLFFVWPGLKLYFDNDDMMNLYFAWSKPLMESYRPLGALFYRGMFAIAGFDPLPFRIACVALGIANLGLCFWFARLVSSSNRVAALAALLFAFHTRMMEVWYRTAVVYDLLCFTFFYLAACLYMSRKRIGVLRCLAIVACFIAALEAKETAVALPVLLAAWYFIGGNEITEYVSRDSGPGIPRAVGPDTSGSLRGTSGRIDAGQPEAERSSVDRSSSAQPGGIKLSLLRSSRKSWPPNRGGTGEFLCCLAPRPAALALWLPLTCGLLDIPYLWFKTHGANALTSIADYRPEYSFTRFAHTWALYLNYLFVRQDRILPWMAIVILVALLSAAILAKSRRLLFAWAVLFVPVLPVAFLAYRGAFVLYTSYPGWTLYTAIALTALQDLLPVRNKTALACLVFALVGWRFGKLNLHDQRADARTWLYRSPAQVRQMVDQIGALEPRLPRGTRCLFLDDAFGTDEWTPYFIMKLLYNDDTLTVDRVKMMDNRKPDLASYQYIFTFENGAYRLLSNSRK